MRDGKHVTAKLRVVGKTQVGSDQTQVSFQPDYQNDRNKDWAAATPALTLSMTMLTTVADLFNQGEAIDMTLSHNPDQPGTLGQDDTE
ncbi:MAG TPA: hypothetical protein VJ769_08005 [Actinomycetes bacterium]|nr:hypothetical protein [Actinomycetes bacterium]